MNLKVIRDLLITLAMILFFALVIVTLNSCAPAKNPDNVTIKESGEFIYYSSGKLPMEIIHMEYNGHKYILFDGDHRLGVVHDPDCPCLKKKQDSLFD